MGFKKNAGFLKQLLWMKVANQKRPLTVIFSLTNACNQSCVYCYAQYPHRGRKGEMGTEEVKKVLSDLYDNGMRRVSFAGGEPLLRKDIDEIIAHVNAIGAACTVNTNGSFFPKLLDKVRGVDALAISIDGRAESHNRFRGEGTGEKALSGAIAAAEAGFRVHTNTVLHRYNLNDIDYMLDLCVKHGFKAEFNLAIDTVFGEKAPEDLKPTNEEFRTALRHLIRRKKEGAPILFSSDAFQSVLDSWKDFKVEGVRDGSKVEGMPECPATRFFCIVDPDGVLWACPHLIGSTPAKSALQEGVAAAFETATTHNCTACYQVYHHEFAHLRDMKPSVVWNYAREAIGA